MYEIKTAGAKGLGVFATTFIPRGTRIFSERPLLAVKAGQDASDLYPSSRQLSSEDQHRFMKLSFHVNKELSVIRWGTALWYTLKQLNIRKSEAYKIAAKNSPPHSIFDHVKVLNIFRSNAFNLGGSPSIQEAVFRRISRINHSCVPNAQGNFHESQGCFNVHATRDIQKDEEISLNYLPENGFARTSRQGELLSGYGFSCDCPACDMSSAKGREGEAKRVKFHEGLVEMNEGFKQSDQASEESIKSELLFATSFIELLEGEGIAGRELSSLYIAASKLNKELGNGIVALKYAERALEIDRDCVGKDHALYLETLGAVQELRHAKS